MPKTLVENDKLKVEVSSGETTDGTYVLGCKFSFSNWDSTEEDKLKEVGDAAVRALKGALEQSNLKNLMVNRGSIDSLFTSIERGFVGELIRNPRKNCTEVFGMSFRFKKNSKTNKIEEVELRIAGPGLGGKKVIPLKELPLDSDDAKALDRLWQQWKDYSDNLSTCLEKAVAKENVFNLQFI